MPNRVIHSASDSKLQCFPLVLCLSLYMELVLRAMKPVFYISLIVLLAWACSPARNVSKTSAKVEPDPADSTQYELVIIDIHFDSWYTLNYSDAKDRTDEYYHSKNLVAASRWNDYYRRGKYIDVVDSYLDYQPQIDYGIELNRKLYWYFSFVEEYYGIKLF